MMKLPIGGVDVGGVANEYHWHAVEFFLKNPQGSWNVYA